MEKLREFLDSRVIFSLSPGVFRYKLESEISALSYHSMVRRIKVAHTLFAANGVSSTISMLIISSFKI